MGCLSKNDTLLNVFQYFESFFPLKLDIDIQNYLFIYLFYFLI